MGSCCLRARLLCHRGNIESDRNLVESVGFRSFNAVGQITTDGYQYDGVGNLVKAPGATFSYNGAQQLTSSTKNGVTTTYEYAGADMNKLLSQSTDGGAEYDYTYGTTDQHGVPVISSRTVAGRGTASVISDPVTGQPMDLQATDGTTSMWIVDGIGNPTAAITDAGEKAYEVHYDPYGAERIADQDKTSTQWQQNPYGFKAGLRSSSTENGLTKFGYRWQSSVTGGWIERDTLDAPLDPSNANRYAYAGADPVNSLDPTGQSASEYVGQCLFNGGFGMLLGAYGGPWGAVAGFAVGCGTGLLSQYAYDQHYPDVAYQLSLYDQVSTGLDVLRRIREGEY